MFNESDNTKWEFLDIGYFYCPYVPRYLKPKLIASSKGVLTEYGKKILEEKISDKVYSPKDGHIVG